MSDPVPLPADALQHRPQDELVVRRRLAATRDIARGVRHPRKRAFLEAYATSGNITLSAEAAGVGRATHYQWLKADPAYVEATRKAKEISADLLEAELRRRATIGVDEPVFYQGQVVGHVKRYSDVLGIFLLKGLRPDVYDRPRSLEHTGPGGGPIAFEANLDRLAEKLREARRLPALPPVTVIDVEAEEA